MRMILLLLLIMLLLMMLMLMLLLLMMLLMMIILLLLMILLLLRMILMNMNFLQIRGCREPPRVARPLPEPPPTRPAHLLSGSCRWAGL